MRDCSWRCLALVAAVAIFSAACGDDSETTSPGTTEPTGTTPDTTEPTGTTPVSTEGTHESHSDTTAPPTLPNGGASDGSGTDGHQHTHGDSTDEMDSSEHDMSGMDSEDDGSMDEMEPAQTIAVEVVGGEPVGGHQRVEVELNSEVAIMVTSDTAEEIHVHGYDILHSVAVGQPLHFSFTADIPGVFEVELEGSGRLLLQLTVS